MRQNVGTVVREVTLPRTVFLQLLQPADQLLLKTLLDSLFWNIKQLEYLFRKSLSMVNHWRNRSGFKISTSKTAAVLFTKKRKPEPIKLVFQSTTVSLRKEYKYLGVIFQSNDLYQLQIYSTFLTNFRND